MAVKIRLARFGAKKRPFYRIVVTDSRSPRDSRYIDILGTYAPLDEPSSIKIDEEKAINWIKNGAQMTNKIHDLFSKKGLLNMVKQESNK